MIEAAALPFATNPSHVVYTSRWSRVVVASMFNPSKLGRTMGEPALVVSVAEAVVPLPAGCSFSVHCDGPILARYVFIVALAFILLLLILLVPVVFWFVAVPRVAPVHVGSEFGRT